MCAAKAICSKKEFVYDTLRERILTASLAPESRLIIDEISDDLGVSPIPIREALQQLQADGLVTIEPYVGARVSKIHQGLIQEVFGLLEALEIISGKSACTRMKERDFLQMKKFLQQMDSQLDDPDGWAASNVQLHQMICQWAEMQLVQALFEKVIVQWNRLRRTYLEDVFCAHMADAHREHWLLLEALRTRDPDRVEQLIREHNQHALDAYLAHLG